jgi:polyribonucleotide nucleotidyltransferase
MTCKTSTVHREIAGRTLTLETGRMAKQAAGSVLVRYGETVVLVAVCDADARPDIDFFPLTVDYREKTYAVGKVPGGFFKREGRPTTKEILTMRLTDRSIRPMFPEGYKREIQIMSQVLAADQENDPDILSMIGAFAAIEVSAIPFRGPMGSCRIGLVGGELVVNPTHSALKRPDARLDLVVAGSPEAIVMVEAGANEVEEEMMVEALELGHRTAKEIAEMCAELREKSGAPAKQPVIPAVADKVLAEAVRERFRAECARALRTSGKHDRRQALEEIRKRAIAAFPAPTIGDSLLDERAKQHREKQVGAFFDEMAFDVEREMILEGTRIDGRKPDEIRTIESEVGLLPRVHGSALFTRGETQALVVTTLGTVEDEQIIDGLQEEEARRKFMLHYNFPPFSVGRSRSARSSRSCPRSRRSRTRSGLSATSSSRTARRRWLPSAGERSR